MRAPLSRDLRERIAKTIEVGGSARATVRRVDVGPSVAITLMRRVRDTGGTVSAKIGGYRWTISKGHEDYLCDLTNILPTLHA